MGELVEVPEGIIKAKLMLRGFWGAGGGVLHRMYPKTRNPHWA